MGRRKNKKNVTQGPAPEQKMCFDEFHDSVETIPEPSAKLSHEPSSNIALQRLRRRANVVENKNNQCKVCYLEFTNQYTLERHEERFVGRKYRCDECETRFADRTQLDTHVRHTHRGFMMGKSHLACHVCNQIFLRVVHLQSHVYHYHEGGPGTSAEASLIEAREKVLIGEEEMSAEDEAKSHPEMHYWSAPCEYLENYTTPEKIEEITTRSKVKARIAASSAATSPRSYPRDKDTKSTERYREVKCVCGAEMMENNSNVSADSKEDVGDKSEQVLALIDAPGQVALSSVASVGTTVSKNMGEKLSEIFCGNDKIAESCVPKDNLQNNTGFEASRSDLYWTDEKCCDFRQNTKDSGTQTDKENKMIITPNGVSDKINETSRSDSETRMEKINEITESNCETLARFDNWVDDNESERISESNKFTLETRVIAYAKFNGPEESRQVEEVKFPKFIQNGDDDSHVVEDTKSKLIQGKKEREKNPEISKNYEIKSDDTRYTRDINAASFDLLKVNKGAEESRKISQNCEKSDNTEYSRVINNVSLTLSGEREGAEESSEISENREKSDNIDYTRVINDASFDLPGHNEGAEKSSEISEKSDNTEYTRVINDASFNLLEENERAEKSREISENREKNENTKYTRVINPANFNLPEENEEAEVSLAISQNRKKSEMINDATAVRHALENSKNKSKFDRYFFSPNTLLSNSKKRVNVKKKYGNVINKSAKSHSAMYTRSKARIKTKKSNRMRRNKTDTKLHTALAEVAALFSGTSVKFPDEKGKGLREILENNEETKGTRKLIAVSNNLQNDVQACAIESNPSDVVERPDGNHRSKVDNNVEECFFENTKITSVQNKESPIANDSLVQTNNTINKTPVSDPSADVFHVNLAKSLEISKNSDEIGNTGDVIPETSLGVPEKIYEMNKSSKSLKKIEETDITLVVGDTSDKAPEKVQETNVKSWQNLGIFERSEGTDNSLVIREDIVDVAERTYENDEPFENSQKFEAAAKSTDNSLFINEESIDIPKKMHENDKSFHNFREIEETEHIDEAFVIKRTDIGVREKAQMSDEWPADFRNGSQIRDNYKTSVIGDEPVTNRLGRIIGRILTSSNTTASSLTKFAEDFNDVVQETVENESETWVPRTNEFEHDNELRDRYACKHCYVSITRVESENYRVRETWSSLTSEVAESSRNSLSRPFSCTFCRATYSSETLRNNHISRCHTIVESVICDKKMANESLMRRHYRDHHSIGCDENETCICGKNMHGYEALEDHFFQHSLPSIPATSNTLLLIRATCKPLKKTHVCPNCGSDFWLKSCLELHALNCPRVSVELPTLPSSRTIVRREFGHGPIGHDELMCRICYAEFPTSTGLLKHEQTYTKATTHRCTICGTKFMGYRLLKGHMRATHIFNIDTTYNFYCIICDQGFTKRIYRRIHMMHIHGEKYPMDVINKPKIHNRLVYDQGNRDDDVSGSRCQICDLVFVNRKRFIDHAVYYNTDEKIVCRICDQHFSGQYNAHRHNKLVHYSADIRNSYPHKCLICQEGFVYKRHLKAHVSHVHDENIDVINLAGSSRNYPAHSLSLSAVARVHMCAICAVRFPSVDLLAAHQIEYTNEGEFVCTRCGKKCRTATLLLDHLSLNHSSTIHESVKCHRCDENFLTPAAWISHVKHYHMSDTREPSEFYLEINIASFKEFRMTDFELIPTNSDIASGTTYEKMRNKVNGTLQENAVNTADVNVAKEVVTTDVDLEGVVDITSDAEPTSDVDVEIIEEMEKTRAPREICLQDKFNAVKTWRCGICNVFCTGPFDLAAHSAFYADKGPYMCEICGRRFTYIGFYEKHRLKHFNHDAKNNHFCDICNEGFDTARSMKMHKAHIHKKKRENRQFEASTRVQNIAIDSSSSTSPSVPSSISPSGHTTNNSAIDSRANPQTSQIPQPSRIPQISQVSQTSQIPRHSQTAKIFQTSHISQMSQIPQTSQITQTSQIPQTSQISQTSQVSQTCQIPQTSQILQFLPRGVDKLPTSAPAFGASTKLAHNKMADSSFVRGKIINPKPTYIYQCANCPNKYLTLGILREHMRNVHKSTCLDNIDTNIYTKTSVKRKGTATIGKKLMTIDTAKIRSSAKLAQKSGNDSPISRPQVTNEKTLGAGSTRLYIVNGTNSRPLLLNGLTNKIDRDKISEPTSHPTLRNTLFLCEFCDLLLDSKDSLNLHKESLHGIRSETSSLAVEPKSSGGKNVVQVVFAKRIDSNAIIPINVKQLHPQSLTQANIQLPLKFSKKMVNGITKKDPMGKMNTFFTPKSSCTLRCEPCDFFFPTEKMLRLHKEQVHSSSSPEIQCIDISISKDDRPSVPTVNDFVKRLKLLRNTLPAVRNDKNDGKNVGDLRSNFDFEPILMPTPLGQLRTIMNDTAESALGTTVNELQVPIVNAESDGSSLKILKVCSLANMTDDLKNETIGKRKHDSSHETVTKRIKQGTFSPITYENLFREHNLKSGTKSGKGKLSIVTVA